MVQTRFAMTFALGIAVAAITIGCNGKTLDANRTQETSPDGRTATQTQVRTRETPSGTVVKETATRTREVVSPATQATTPPDARQRDPSVP